MGIIKRIQKLNSDTSLSLGKVRMGGLAIALILLLGIGEKLIPRWLDLSPEVANIVSKAMGFVVAAFFIAIVAIRLMRLSARSRWAMICIFGSGALAGQIVSVLCHIGEEKSGLSEYFPYDVILYIVAIVGGYIGWRVATARIRRIKLEREERIRRRNYNI